jgi:formate hydrogenlyase subunit 6/NADH:ubiquinone oxidoreductase subunit I
MAYQITDKCVACGLCKDACPVAAINEGTPYTIDAIAVSALASARAKPSLQANRTRVLKKR